MADNQNDNTKKSDNQTNNNESINLDPNIQVEELPEEVSTPDIQVSPEELEVTDEPMIYVEDNKRKYIIILVIFIVLFSAVFFLLYKLFLSNRPKTSAKKVELTYWGLWDDKEIIQPLIDEYQKKNPNVKINYELKSVKDAYAQKIVARTERGVGPDIFRFHNSWIPELKEVLSYAPESVVSADEFSKQYYNSIVKDLVIDKKVYGLPLMIDGLLLIYNEDLLKTAGISSPPATWDAFIEAVEKTTVKDSSGNILTSGIALGTAGNIQHFSDILLLMLYQNGGSIANLQAQEAIDILSQYRRFAEPPNNVWSETMPDSVVAFAEGKVAMIFAPSWQILIIKQINKDINVKSAPVPQVPGADPLSIGSYWIEGVSRKSENQLEAWKFLKYLSEKDQLLKLYENQSKVRLFGTAYPLKELGATLSDNPYLSGVVKQADYFITTYGIARTFDDGLNDNIIKYLENAVNATAQGVSYRDAMQTAHQGVVEVLSRYNLISDQ
ncbi:MAG: hypothetical protein KatS3mg090_0881 [Patescibacteria group bacterium]|nr:MAG: hypothetical protein KatS3mg090_0881 [Patescibacteria group bacterium]